MKKVVLFALLFAAVAVSAQAQSFNTPSWGEDYFCTYTNPPYPSVNGISTFVKTSTQYDADYRPIYRGIEYFDTSNSVDNRKFTFAKPVNMNYGTLTRWEFTINPGGPQCKNTDVHAGGYIIYFNNCTDGHTRQCQRLY